MLDLDAAAAERLLDGQTCNMIRRGGDGSLIMSADTWRLVERGQTAWTFRAEPPAPPDVAPLTLDVDEIERLAWDRLPKQQIRSQVRFFLRNGDVVTFSGALGDPPAS